MGGHMTPMRTWKGNWARMPGHNMIVDAPDRMTARRLIRKWMEERNIRPALADIKVTLIEKGDVL